MGRLAIGRAQRLHTEGAKFVMHPVQVAMAENLGITVSSVITVSADVLNSAMLPDHPKTFCGRPIVVDPKMPQDVIELRDRNGTAIARILNLAVPNERRDSDSH